MGDALIPLVPGAILFDLLNGGDKDWAQNPYADLGRQALEAAGEDFQIGSVGAGTGALSAMVKGGLGSASLQLPDGSTVGAVVGGQSGGRRHHPRRPLLPRRPPLRSTESSAGWDRTRPPGWG